MAPCNFIIVLLSLSVVSSTARVHVLDDVISSVFKGYHSEVRPYCNDTYNNTVVVTIDIGVRQLVDLNEPKQTINIGAWMRMNWLDCRLKWNKSLFNEIETFAVPQNKIWIPDVTLYDTDAVAGLPGMRDYRAVVHSSGAVKYQFPSNIKSSCKIDVFHFPFDTQTCRLVFGSWIYTGFEVNIVNKSNTMDMSSFIENTEWKVIGADAMKVVNYYGDQTYPTFECVLRLRRKPLFYVMNLLFPCFVVSFMAALGFVLPPQAGEKVNLQITILLSLAVFQLVTVNMIPPSGEKTPLLAIYFLVSMILVGFSCLMTVLVLNIHYKNIGSVSPRIRKYVIRPLKKITCLHTEQKHDKNDNLYTTQYEKERVYKNYQVQPVEINSDGNNERPKGTGFQKQLLDILIEIRDCISSIVTNQNRDSESSDWSVLAIALDRIFLIGYLVCTFVMSLSIMLTASSGY